VIEGNAGSKTIVPLTVELSRNSDVEVTVSYTLNDSSAVAGEDYQGATGKLVFAPGQTRATIPVTILGDDKYEGREWLSVSLAGATNAEIVAWGSEPGRMPQFQVGITNDDKYVAS
jgi:hypothetical protein